MKSTPKIATSKEMTDEPTKTRILEAARELFVEHGYAGTSMGKVANLAQVNHSLIFHHFGNKEGLWIAVKQSIVKRASENKAILPSTALPFVDFLKDLLENSIRFYKDNPDICKLIFWQRIEKGENQAIGVTQSEEVKMWIAALEHYKKSGAIAKHHQLEFIMTAICALASSAVLDPNIFLQSPEQEQAYLKTCVDILIKGLRGCLESPIG